ncbi:MAG: hypothetical protein IID51_03620 [Proteobacteria bacterium]|nr:hypothetical protein [Pseudomonadota bacterium]
MRFQPFIALALVISGAFAGPVAAQEDERFYGRWEPASTSAIGSTVWIEADGYFNIMGVSGEDWSVRRFQVIKDFGPRIIVRIWNAQSDPSVPEKNDLIMLEVYDRDKNTKYWYRILSFKSCYSVPARKFIFQDFNPENIWRRARNLTTGMADASYDWCKITEDGEFSGNWSGMSWWQKITSDAGTE